MLCMIQLRRFKVTTNQYFDFRDNVSQFLKSYYALETSRSTFMQTKKAHFENE